VTFIFTSVDPRCNGNEIWDKIGYNSACVRDFWKILAPMGGFRGWAIECCQSHFSSTDPGCHGNQICGKICYNSACVKKFCEIFAFIEGFRWWAIECCQLHFPPTDPHCHDNEIRNKIGYTLIKNPWVTHGKLTEFHRRNMDSMGKPMSLIPVHHDEIRCRAKALLNAVICILFGQNNKILYLHTKNAKATEFEACWTLLDS